MNKILLILCWLLIPLPNASAESPDLILNHEHPIAAVAWRYDETQLAAATGYYIDVWEVTSGEKRLQLPHNSPARGVQWSPDGTKLASWGSSDPVYCDSDCGVYEVRVWNAETGRILLAVNPQVEVHQVLWSRDGNEIFVADDAGGAWWDAQTSEILTEYLLQEGGLSRAAWNADGTRLWTQVAETSQVLVWDMTLRGKQTTPLFTAKHEGFIGRAAWSPDGSKLVDFNISEDVLMREAEKGDILFSMPHDGYIVYGALWSKNSQRLLTWSPDENGAVLRFRVWDAHTGDVVVTWDVEDWPYPDSVNWNGEQVAGISVTNFYLWDAATGELTATLPYAGGVSSSSVGVAWNKRNSLMLAWSEANGVATLWRNERKIMEMEYPEFAEWSPRETYIWGLSFDSKSILIWNTP